MYPLQSESEQNSIRLENEKHFDWNIDTCVRILIVVNFGYIGKRSCSSPDIIKYINCKYIAYLMKTVELVSIIYVEFPASYRRPYGAQDMNNRVDRK